MKILMEDFNAKVGREDIFKPVHGNKSLRDASNDNGDRIVNFATSENLIAKSTQRFHTAAFINTLGLLRMMSHTIK
jgi:hypothetical protein